MSNQPVSSQSVSSPVSNQSVLFIERPGCFFETHSLGEPWSARPDPAALAALSGTRVEQLPQLLVEFYAALPDVSDGEPGRYPLFSLTHENDVFLRVAYEPSQSLIHFATNVGKDRELEWLVLSDAKVERLYGRVFRWFVLIDPEGLFPSVDDPYTGHEEFFGELHLKQAGRGGPWDALGSGSWRVSVNVPLDADEQSGFPAGLGLSDLRITVLRCGSENREIMPYSGELDHLVDESWLEIQRVEEVDDWVFKGDLPIEEILIDLAEQLDVLSGGVSTWARRAQDLADETRQLGLRHGEGLLVDDLYEPYE